MDHRIALKPKTPLCLCNDKGEQIHCVIEKEIGRGGSCIVYEASRVTKTGDATLYRVKEFYPYKPDIKRGDDNTLTASSKDAQLFRIGKERFLSDFSRTNELFYSGANYSSMTNQLDVFSLNGTYYALSAYSSEKTLAAYRPESMKECVTIVKQVAFVLENIHKHGYLYLDTKPDNILITDGYQKQIQLFDFDSLFSLSRINKDGDPQRGNERLSYSKGFAPVELQTSKVKCLGPHTDVYTLGALLYYLLFGYTPTAPDCEEDAEFDYTKIKYDFKKCDDRLFSSLDDFFHNALAVYYADRYQSMQETIEQLEIIEKHADTMIPRIYSTQIIRPKVFYGRENEFEELDRLLANANHQCLFITGMGGIGKSTFIKEYLTRSADKFDTRLYVYFKDSLEATISDDDAVTINTLHQTEEIKSGKRYFDTKIKKLREIVRDTSSVLVIDNFNGEVDEDFLKLIRTGLKIIMLTRNNSPYQSFPEMKIGTISDTYALRRIFENNLGRSLTANELGGFKEILKRVEGHTLILELIAKQIANSHITISSAASLTEEYGFSSIAREKVDYEKDSKRISDTIGNIVDALFTANSLSEEKKTLMKVFSLLGDEGIDINQFQQIMKLESKDDLNELINDGWLMISGDSISMHRVIMEAVHRWDWTPVYVNAAESFLTYLYTEIWLESTKNNYPQKLQRHFSAVFGDLPPELSDKWILQRKHAFRKQILENLSKRHGIIGQVMRERIRRFDDLPADIEKLSSFLSLSESILQQCKHEPIIKSNERYLDLLYVTLINTLKYRNDDYILSEAKDIFLSAEKSFVLQRASELIINDSCRNPIAIMKLHARVFEINMIYGNRQEAESQLTQARVFAEKVRHDDVYALYYDLIADYYDILLDGNYDTEDTAQERLLNLLLDTIEKILHYSKRRAFYDGDHLYAKGLLSKATVLMRSNRGTEKEIDDLIGKAKKVITDNTSQYADVRLYYYLVCAWYFVYVHKNIKYAEECINKARKLSDIIVPTDLQRIEEVIIPCANICFELNWNTKSMALLYEGTRLCRKHANSDAYARKKQELCDHCFEVGINAQQAEVYQLCQVFIKLIEIENEEIVNPQNRVVISDNIRSIITDHIT